MKAAEHRNKVGAYTLQFLPGTKKHAKIFIHRNPGKKGHFSCHAVTHGTNLRRLPDNTDIIILRTL